MANINENNDLGPYDSKSLLLIIIYRGTEEATFSRDNEKVSIVRNIVWFQWEFLQTFESLEVSIQYYSYETQNDLKLW